MNAVEIVKSAHEMGITLAVERGLISARPKGATPSELAETIRKHKAELLAYLQRKQELARLATADGWQPESDTDRIARLDAERHVRDRKLKRGYDYDCSAPSHREYLERTGRDCTCLRQRRAWIEEI